MSLSEAHALMDLDPVRQVMEGAVDDMLTRRGKRVRLKIVKQKPRQVVAPTRPASAGFLMLVVYPILHGWSL